MAFSGLMLIISNQGDLKLILICTKNGNLSVKSSIHSSTVPEYNFEVLYFSISFCYFILSLARTSEANIDVFTTVHVLVAVATMQIIQTKQHIKYDALCYGANNQSVYKVGAINSSSYNMILKCKMLI